MLEYNKKIKIFSTILFLMITLLEIISENIFKQTPLFIDFYIFFK